MREFYGWYIRTAITSDEGWLQSVLKQTTFALAPGLRHQLQLYARLPDNPNGEIEGLDFDPFLNAQDNADKYEFGKLQRKRGTYWVPVYGIWSGRKNSEPDIVAEVEINQGRWSFINFHYGNKRSDENLIKTLKRIIENPRLIVRHAKN